MMKEKKLSANEKIRYSRHLNIPDFGLVGQRKLKSSAVLVAGCGGLGSSSAMYLAAAGLGKIGIVDSDIVELSNLQRQIIHSMDSIGKLKVESARERISALNPNVEIEMFHARIEEGNVNDIIGGYPIVVDATDNFQTRYILNECCVSSQIPFVYGAIFQFSGQISIFNSQDGPCFRCVFQKEPDQNFVDANQGVGVIGALPGVIGALQAVEVIKMITGLGKSMVGRLLIFDGLDMNFKEVQVKKNPLCPVCSR